MGLKSVRAFTIIGCFLFLSGNLVAQNCVLTGINNTSISSSCSQTCRDLSFQIPDISASSTYKVVSIPYNPYPYIAAGGTEDPRLYNDDNYSAVFNLPFPFCFYDSVYTKAVVSSNGLVTFDTSNANCFNGGAAYFIDSIIPHGGFASCIPNDYPRASIMAAFMDLDPRPGPLDPTFSSPPDRKIQWRVEGTAPCRRFVVSYYHIGAYAMTTCGQNPDSAATFQIVMYESTGLIDIFFQNKSCNGLFVTPAKSILGVQNFSRTQAVAAPGKNALPWTASHEGYRFVPSGGTSRFVSSELLTMNLSHIAFANSSTSTPGLLDITFPNICSPASTRYIVRTIFSACDNPAVQLTAMDTITINLKDTLNPTAIATNTTCGPSSGTITVTIPAGATPPFSYVLNGGTPVVSPAFTHTFNNVAQGPHTVMVTDGNNACTGSVNITVNQTNTLNATISSTATACSASNGTITITPVNGTAPYTFSLDGGSQQAGQAPYTFINVAAGLHNIIVTDAFNCAINIDVTVASNPLLTTTVNKTDVLCNGGSTGIITITQPTIGTAPYQYSLDGITWQAANTFNGLVAGTYTVYYRESNGCQGSQPVVITQPTQLTASCSATPITTVGGTTTVTVTAAGGTAPYTGTGTFTRNAGAFTFTVTDANGCTAATSITLTEPGCNLLLSTVVNNVSCNGGGNGAIDLTVTGATGAVRYTWSNAATTEDISGLTAGTYSVTVVDESGCRVTATATLTQPTQLTASSSAAPIATVNGSTTLTVTATGGTAPYTGTGTFTRNAGTFTFTVTDANGCTATTSITLTEPGCNLGLSTVVTNVSCNGGSNGAIDLTVTGATGSVIYRWSNAATTEDIGGLTAGTYTLTATDASGCIATVTATVSVNNNLTFSMGNDTTICEGGSAQLVATSNATVFIWTPATALNNSSIGNPVASPTITTQYTMTATLGDCSVNGIIKVTVKPAPIPNAGPDTDICFGQNAQLSASGGAIYQWTPSIYLSSAASPNPIVIQPRQTTQYKLQVKDSNGCTSLITDDVFVKIAPLIKVSVSPKDSVVTEGDQIQLNATSIGNSYSWTNSSTLSNPNIPNPVAAIPSGSIGNIYTYTVTASTSAGCMGTASVTLKVSKGPDIYLPTGFTPNGDGKNDRFYPLTVGIKKINYFRVFNRWGQIVFSSPTFNEGWDGKLGGIEQPGGVYVWMVQGITTDDKVITKKGTVVLIR